MLKTLASVLSRRKLLLAVAAEKEARAVLAAFGRAELPGPWNVLEASDVCDVLLTGVGKANAAGAVAKTLAASGYGAVLSVGVAGSYSSLQIGAVVLGVSSLYADEGVQAPDTFLDIAALGFPPTDLPGTAFPADPRLLEALRHLADSVGSIATVSSCSGTDALAVERAGRTGAIAESMEGAAVAHTAHRLGIPCAELRVISNNAGQRDRQVWNLPAALDRLTDVIGRICL